MATKKLKAHLSAQGKAREKMKFEFEWTVVGAESLPVKEGTRVVVQWRRGSAKKAGATSTAAVDDQHSVKWNEKFSVKTTILSDPLTNNFDQKSLSFSIKDERKKKTIARLTLNLGDHVHRTASQSVSFPLVLSSSYSPIEGAAPPTVTLIWYSNLLQVGNRKTQRLQTPPPSAVAHLKKGIMDSRRSSRILGGQEFVLADEVDTSEASETSLDAGSEDDDDVTEFAVDESVAEDDEPLEKSDEEEDTEKVADANERQISEKSDKESSVEEAPEEATTSHVDTIDKEAAEPPLENTADRDDTADDTVTSAATAEDESSDDIDAGAAPPSITVTETDPTEADAIAKESQDVSGDAEEMDVDESLKDSTSRKKKDRRKSELVDSDEGDESKRKKKDKKDKKDKKSSMDEEGGDVEKREKSRDSSSRHKKSHKNKGSRAKTDGLEESAHVSLSSIGAEVAAQAKEVEEMKKHKSKNKHLMRSVVEEAAAKAGKRSTPKGNSSASSRTVKAVLDLELPVTSKHKKHRKSMDEAALSSSIAEVDTGDRLLKDSGGSSSSKSVIPGLDLSSKVKSVLSSGKKTTAQQERDGSKERQRGLSGAGGDTSPRGSSASATAQAAVGTIWEGLNRVGRALPGPISTDAYKKETGQVLLSMANEVQELKNRIAELEGEKEQLEAMLAGKEKTTSILQTQVNEMSRSILQFEQDEQKRVIEEKLRIAAEQEVVVRANTRRTRSTDLAILLDPVAASKRRGYLYVLRMIVLILALMLLREIF